MYWAVNSNNPLKRVEGKGKLPALFPGFGGLRRRSVHILLVEDDDLIRLATADMLGELGHRIFEACDAREALEILGRETIDVLLTDDRLPGMSGRELAVEVRQRRPSTGVIFACGTNIVSELSAHEALAGAIQLLKPYDGDGLKAALEASAAYANAKVSRDT